MTSLNPSHRNLIEFVLSVNDAQAKNAINKFGTEIRRNLRDFQTAGSGTFDQAFRTPKNFAEFRSNLTRLRTDLNSATSTGWIGMNQLSDGFRTGRMELQRLTGGVRAAVNVTNFSRQFDALTSRWMSMAKNFQWTGRQLVVGLTLPLAMFGKMAIDTFLKIEQEYTRLRKVVTEDIWSKQTNQVEDWGRAVQDGIKILDAVEQKGKGVKEAVVFKPDVDATVGENLKNLGKEISVTFGASQKQVAALMADWSAMGYQAADLGQIVSTVLKTGILGDFGSNLEGASNLVRSTMAIWAQDAVGVAEKFNEVNNLMAKASAIEANTSIWMGELATSLPEVSNSARIFGLEFDQLLGILAAMKQRGIESQEAAHGLKFMLQRLTNPTDKAREAFEKFTGVNLEKLLSGKSGIDRLVAITNEINKLRAQGPAGRDMASRLIGDLSGLRQADRFISAMNGMQAGMGELANKSLKVSDYTEDYARAIAAAAAEQDVLNAAAGKKIDVNLQSYPQQIRILQAQLESLKSSLGEEIVPYFIKGFTALINLFKKFEAMSSGAKKFILGIAASAATLGPVILVLGQLGLALASIAHLANKIPLFAGNSMVKLFSRQSDQLLMVAGAIETSQAQAAAMSQALLANAERLTASEQQRLYILESQNAALLQQARASTVLAGQRAGVTRESLVGLLPEMQQRSGRLVTDADILAEVRSRPDEFGGLLRRSPELESARARRAAALAAYTADRDREFTRLIAGRPELLDPIAGGFDRSHVVGGDAGLAQRYRRAERAAGRTPLKPGGKGAGRGSLLRYNKALRDFFADNFDEEVALARRELAVQANTAVRNAPGPNSSARRLRLASTRVNALTRAHEAEIISAVRDPDTYATGAFGRLGRAGRAEHRARQFAGRNLIPEITEESERLGLRTAERVPRRPLIFGQQSRLNEALRFGGRGLRSAAGAPTRAIDAATAPLAGGVGIWSRFTGAINNARQSLGRFLTNLPGIGPILGRVGRAVQTFGTTLRTAFIANPIGIVVAAIIALLALLPAIAALTGHWDDFKEGFMNGISGIKDIFMDAWDSIKEAGMALFDALKVIWQSIVGIVQSVIGVFVDFGDKGNKSGKKTQSGWAQIGNIFGIVAKVLANIVKILAFIIKIVANVIAIIVKLIAGVINFAVSLAKSFGFLDILGNIIGFIISLIRGDWVNALKYLGNSIIQFMLWPFVAAINLMIKAYNALPFKNIKEIKIGNILGAEKISFDFDGKKAGEKGAKEADPKLKPPKLPTPETQDDIAGAIGDAVADGASDGADKANEIMMDMINALKSRLDEQLSRVKEQATKAFDKKQKNDEKAFDKAQQAAREAEQKRQNDFIKKNFDNRIKSIENLNKADEKRYATEEYLANRREALEKRQLDRTNFLRSRRAAMFAGNIDKVRQLDMEEIKSKKDAEKALADMDEQRRRELVQETRQAAIDRINIEKEAQLKLFEQDMKTFEERQAAAKEAFAAQQELERQNFEDSLTNLTEYTPTSIEEWNRMLQGINALLASWGIAPIFANTAALSVNAFVNAIRDAENDLDDAADWAGKTFALKWLESFWNVLSGYDFRKNFKFVLQGLDGGSGGGSPGGEPKPEPPKPEPTPAELLAARAGNFGGGSFGYQSGSVRPGKYTTAADLIEKNGLDINLDEWETAIDTADAVREALDKFRAAGAAGGEETPSNMTPAEMYRRARSNDLRNTALKNPDGSWKAENSSFSPSGNNSQELNLDKAQSAGFTGKFSMDRIKALGDWASKAGNWLKTNIPKFFKGAWNWFKGIGGWLFDAVKKGVDIGAKIGGWIRDKITGLPGKLGGFFSAIGDWFNGLGGWLFDRIKSGASLLTKIVGWLRDIVSKLISRIGSIFSRVFNWFKALPGKFMDRIREGIGFGARLIGWLTRGVSGFADRLGSIFSRVFSWFTNLPSKIVEKMGDIAGAFTDVGGDIISGIGKGLQNAVSFVGDVASSVWKALTGLLDKYILTPMYNFSAFGKHWLRSVVDTIRGLLKIDTAMAEGGIVVSPTQALIGEAGPELVLPLSKPARMNALLMEAQRKGLIKPMKFNAPLTGGTKSFANASAGGGSGMMIQETNIYVDNFIGERAWFESMMKEYNVRVRSSDQTSKGRVTRNISSYKDNLSRYA